MSSVELQCFTEQGESRKRSVLSYPSWAVRRAAGLAAASELTLRSGGCNESQEHPRPLNKFGTRRKLRFVPEDKT